MSHVAHAQHIRGIALDEVTRARLRTAIERDGVPTTSRRLRVTVSSLGRAVGGLPILYGTALAISTGLADEMHR